MRRATPLALLLVLAWPAAVRAHAIVDEARARYEQAEFAAALDALDRAEAADDLSREDLVEALALRLLLGVANGDSGSLERDVRRLVAVAPEYAPGDELPPEVHEAIAAARDAARGPIRVAAEATRDGDEATVEAAVENDPGGLTRELRVSARADDGDPTVGASPLTVGVAGAGAVYYFAEAVGPGGVVVASAGSAGDPLRLALDAVGEEDVVVVGGGDDALIWGLVGGIGGAVVVAGVIVLVVVLTSEGGQSDLTRPTLPMVIGE